MFRPFTDLPAANDRRAQSFAAPAGDFPLGESATAKTSAAAAQSAIVARAARMR
jgi:hypothetical protein